MATDPDATVYDAIAQWAERAPERPAISFGDRTWSHRALDDEVLQLAAGLRAAGLEQGDCLAVFASNHPAVAFAWLAGARTGIVSSVINQFLQAPELAWILGKLRAKGVLTDREHLPVVRSALAESGLDAPVWLIEGREPGTLDYASLLEHGREAGPRPRPDDVLEITYTSGTTGHPKGAVFDHRAHLYLCDAVGRRYHMDRDSRMFTVMPLFHAGGLRASVLTILMGGGHSIIGEFSLADFWSMVRARGITHITAIDTILMLLMNQPAADDDADNPVRYAMGVGAPDLLNGFENRFDLDFIQAYGMTECGIVCTTPDISREAIQRARLERPGNNFVGRALGDETEVRLVDETGKEVPEGEVGQFVLRSPGMLREYFEDSEGTRSILRDGWLHSGDLGFKGRDGMLYFVDREKDMIRRSGENISPAQVEEVLVAHPGVAQATVIRVPDALRGEAVKTIVVPLEGAEPSADELWEWCDARLAHYKVPRYIEFREAIPMNASKKVLKHQLRQEPIEGEGRCFDRGDRRFKDVRGASA